MKKKNYNEENLYVREFIPYDNKLSKNFTEKKDK